MGEDKEYKGKEKGTRGILKYTTPGGERIYNNQEKREKGNLWYASNAGKAQLNLLRPRRKKSMVGWGLNDSLSLPSKRWRGKTTQEENGYFGWRLALGRRSIAGERSKDHKCVATETAGKVGLRKKRN